MPFTFSVQFLYFSLSILFLWFSQPSNQIICQTYIIGYWLLCDAALVASAAAAVINCSSEFWKIAQICWIVMSAVDSRLSFPNWHAPVTDYWIEYYASCTTTKIPLPMTTEMISYWCENVCILRICLIYRVVKACLDHIQLTQSTTLFYCFHATRQLNGRSYWYILYLQAEMRSQLHSLLSLWAVLKTNIGFLFRRYSDITYSLMWYPNIVDSRQRYAIHNLITAETHETALYAAADLLTPFHCFARFSISTKFVSSHIFIYLRSFNT